MPLDKNWYFLAVPMGMMLIMGVSIILAPTDAAIPPTPSFSKVSTGVDDYTATRYNEVLNVPKYAYAQLSDLSTQQCAAAGAASNVTINNNDAIYGITHSNTTNTHEVIIQSRGTYQIIAAPQVGEAVVQADGIHNFWMMKNNQQVPNTNIKMSIILQLAGSETMVGVLNWVGYLEAGDVVHFQQSCSDADIGLIFTAAGTEPATPSVIISVAKLDW